MNLLDLILLGTGVLAMVGGYRLGFLTRTASWVGMAVGLFLGARTLPWLVEQFEGESPASLLLLGGIVLLVGSFLGQAVGVVVGSRLRVNLQGTEWSIVDRAFGAVAGALGMVVAVWLLLPTMAEVPGAFSSQARNSVIARSVDRIMPAPPDALVALRRLVGEDQFPRVFDAMRPAPDVGPPPTDAQITPEVVAAVAPSTVKVSGIACSRVQEGSGFVTVAPDVVVTNAHVVAGQTETEVELTDGSRLDAAVVVFDPDRDLAVLRVPGLDRSPLPILDAPDGVSGGVFGHPGGAPLRVQPFQVGDEVRAVGTDIYDQRRTEREVLILASALRPGDSGAALVDGAGNVIGVAFAIAPDDPDVAYGLDVPELQAVLAGDLATPVETGPCLR
ncbi:MarP family serine protease [Acidimicrobiia bacterium EGI L10123]|uniref:MarP family serine protease n=1 Tax=Salinilacustrithrix flava TaxID=2957203 RepID=UPI003D7C14B2|nr:MarP family serine protease [Acidimicrobiia bacterium EGI L10123]